MVTDLMYLDPVLYCLFIECYIMNVWVYLEYWRLSEGLATYLAHMWLHPKMNPHMESQCDFWPQFIAAVLAHELTASVLGLMVSPDILFVQWFVATSVHLHGNHDNIMLVLNGCSMHWKNTETLQGKILVSYFDLKSTKPIGIKELPLFKETSVNQDFLFTAPKPLPIKP